MRRVIAVFVGVVATLGMTIGIAGASANRMSGKVMGTLDVHGTFWIRHRADGTWTAHASIMGHDVHQTDNLTVEIDTYPKDGGPATSTLRVCTLTPLGTRRMACRINGLHFTPDPTAITKMQVMNGGTSIGYATLH